MSSDSFLMFPEDQSVAFHFGAAILGCGSVLQLQIHRTGTKDMGGSLSTDEAACPGR